MPVNSYTNYSTPPLNNNVNWIPVRRRDLLQQQFPVSIETMPSLDVRGSDMPSDMGTLRFFYNLGHEYYLQLQEKHSIQAIGQLARCSTGCGPNSVHLESETVFDSSFTDNEPISSLGNDFNKIKLEKSCNQVGFMIARLYYFIDPECFHRRVMLNDALIVGAATISDILRVRRRVTECQI